MTRVDECVSLSVCMSVVYVCAARVEVGWQAEDPSIESNNPLTYILRYVYALIRFLVTL